MSEIEPELVERMAALVRKVAAYAREHVGGIFPGYAIEAQAIVAELPTPVDPDLLIAREVARALWRDDDPTDPACAGTDMDEGAYDRSTEVIAALAAIKRIRSEQGA